MSPRLAVVISLVALVASGASAALTVLTISGADEVLEIALRWKAIAEHEQGTAHAWRMVARLASDDLAICNSMLPPEKRL